MTTKRNITFKTIKLKNHAFGYKYNVKKYVNGYYAGIGKFCRTKAEVDKFKRKNK